MLEKPSNGSNGIKMPPEMSRYSGKLSSALLSFEPMDPNHEASTLFFEVMGLSGKKL